MFTLPDLPYPHDALEPFIDEKTMHIHHDKHHAAYVKNLNDAFEGHSDWLAMDVNIILASLDKVPEAIRTKVRNNGGGVANHNLYWQIMVPPQKGGGRPSGKLAKAIEDTFESFEKFVEKMSAAGLNHFGSGWAWLVIDKDKKLAVTDTSNQDSPVSLGQIPLLNLDVWEHAYYLKYQNLRGDYIKAWWNVVNWPEVEKRFAAI